MPRLGHSAWTCHPHAPWAPRQTSHPRPQARHHLLCASCQFSLRQKTLVLPGSCGIQHCQFTCHHVGFSPQTRSSACSGAMCFVSAHRACLKGGPQRELIKGLFRNWDKRHMNVFVFFSVRFCLLYPEHFVRR